MVEATLCVDFQLSNLVRVRVRNVVGAVRVRVSNCLLVTNLGMYSMSVHRAYFNMILRQWGHNNVRIRLRLGVHELASLEVRIPHMNWHIQ